MSVCPENGFMRMATTETNLNHKEQSIEATIAMAGSFTLIVKSVGD